MAKKNKNPRGRQKYDDDDEYGYEPYLLPETKKGILGVTLTAIAAISFLSYFGLAGQLGGFLEHALSLAFGVTRWFFPIVLLIASYFILAKDEESQMSFMGYLGLILLFLSVNGIIHVLTLPQELPWTSSDLLTAGGYVGVALGVPLQTLAGTIATLVVLASLVVISLLIVLNTSLRQLGRKTFFWVGWFGAVKNFLKSEDETFQSTYAEDSSDSEEEGNEENDTDEEIGFQKKQLSPVQSSSDEQPATSALISKRKRKHIDLPLDLLTGKPSKPTSGDIVGNTAKITKAFENFSIDIEMGDINVGPTVTQYAFKPADGVKLSRIRALSDDLALALAAHPIRIEAPIPGKSLVGIEVPNQVAATVTLKELIDSKEFKKRESNMMIALGKDVSGAPWFADVTKMPHMLIAGATGSGKTICINSIILSLLYQNGPDDLKFIMVDPKRVELHLYNGIPHLVSPVITDVKKTVNALKWCVAEMDRRFEILSKMKQRDIHGYNSVSEQKMPYLVVIIDELADLMSTSAQEVEAMIIRLSQMARAVGIHLILATQRPSVDVITGLIKANITTRLAFSVASVMDSRTILDSSGAEKLLGRGDMLFISSSMSKPKRIQGAFISDQDTKRVADYLKDAFDEPEYDETILEPHASAGMMMRGGEAVEDDLYEEAQRLILEHKKASASFLQRRMKVGYARAARLLDMLEEAGVVGPADGAKPREILVDQISGHDTMSPEDDTDNDTFDDIPLDSENEDEYEEEEEVEKV